MDDHDQVHLSVNTNKSHYVPGDTIEGVLDLRTAIPDLEILKVRLEWHIVTTYSDHPEDNKILWRKTQLITNQINEQKGEHRHVPISVTLPANAPTSLEHYAEVRVMTQLVVDVVLGTPLDINIHHEYSIKVVRPLDDPSRQKKGILQTVEFPVNGWCCSQHGMIDACIEVRKQVFTAGDRVHATVVINTEHCMKGLRGISLCLRRHLKTNEVDIDEELYEGAISKAIKKGTQTTILVHMNIPEEHFVGDTETVGVQLTNAIGVIFHGYYGWKYDAEIPITLIHPEVITIID